MVPYVSTMPRLRDALIGKGGKLAKFYLNTPLATAAPTHATVGQLWANQGR